jgi:hypothetical protein
MTLQEAGRILVADPRREALALQQQFPMQTEDNRTPAEILRAIRAANDALQNHRRLRSIEVFSFDHWGPPHRELDSLRGLERFGPAVRQQISDELDRLFRDILPHHRSLTEILLEFCDARYVALFAQSLPTDRPVPLHTLMLPHFCGSDALRPVAAMIRRNVPLTELRIGPTYSTEGMKLICDAVGHNPNLRKLVNSNDIAPCPVLYDQALGAGSRLIDLECHIDSLELLRSMVERLKVNRVLQRLVLAHYDYRRLLHQPLCQRSVLTPEAGGELEDLLDRHNFTLREVTILNGRHPRQPRVNELLRRNAGVRAANEQLEARQYAVALPLLPAAAGRVRRFPTLLYRLLRRGNVGALADQLVAAAEAEAVSHAEAASVGVDAALAAQFDALRHLQDFRPGALPGAAAGAAGALRGALSRFDALAAADSASVPRVSGPGEAAAAGEASPAEAVSRVEAASAALVDAIRHLQDLRPGAVPSAAAGAAAALFGAISRAGALADPLRGRRPGAVRGAAVDSAAAPRVSGPGQAAAAREVSLGGGDGGAHNHRWSAAPAAAAAAAAAAAVAPRGAEGEADGAGRAARKRSRGE